MLYRYKKIIADGTTYTINPPTLASAIIDGYYEHGVLDDGYTYVVSPVPLTAPAVCLLEQVTPPQQYKQKLREISPHYELLQKRAARGEYLRADGHLATGDPGQVADWQARMKTIFGCD